MILPRLRMPRELRDENMPETAAARVAWREQRLWWTRQQARIWGWLAIGSLMLAGLIMIVEQL